MGKVHVTVLSNIVRCLYCSIGELFSGWLLSVYYCHSEHLLHKNLFQTNLTLINWLIIFVFVLFVFVMFVILISVILFFIVQQLCVVKYLVYSLHVKLTSISTETEKHF